MQAVSSLSIATRLLPPEILEPVRDGGRNGSGRNCAREGRRARCGRGALAASGMSTTRAVGLSPVG
jgi:hypothetical protein